MKKKLLTLILALALSVNFAIQANAETAGWYNNSGTWYYYYSDGSMATGWIESSGKWYYMLNDGSMATNTKVNGYYLDKDGV
jgi:glucan-binding YG repeat protein